MAGTDRDQATCNCDMANLFLCDMSDSAQSTLNVRCMVNGNPTPILPVGETYLHPNTVEGTTQQLEFVHAGGSSVILDDISAFNPNTAEDLRTYVGHRPPPPEDPQIVMLEQLIASPTTVHTMRPQYQRRLEELRAAERYEDREAVYMLAISSGGIIAQGRFDLATMPIEQQFALAEALAPAFGIDWNDVNSFYNGFGGSVMNTSLAQVINLERTMQGMAPRSIDFSQLSIRQQAALRMTFLKEIISTQFGQIKMVNGQEVVTFRGRNGLRQFIRRTYYPAGSVAAMDIGVASGRTNAMRSAAGGVFRGVGGKLLFIGGVLHVTDWLSTEGNRPHISALFVDLGLMVAVAVISAVLATALIMATSLVAGTVLFGLAVAGTGILIAAGIGWALEASGATDAMKAMARRFAPVLTAITNAVLEPIEEGLTAVSREITRHNNQPMWTQLMQWDGFLQ
ncbi:MAG: hypothetical protein ABJL99_20210 [Aliishimia sp.]